MDKKTLKVPEQKADALQAAQRAGSGHKLSDGPVGVFLVEDRETHKVEVNRVVFTPEAMPFQYGALLKQYGPDSVRAIYDRDNVSLALGMENAGRQFEGLPTMTMAEFEEAEAAREASGIETGYRGQVAADEIAHWASQKYPQGMDTVMNERTRKLLHDSMQAQPTRTLAPEVMAGVLLYPTVHDGDIKRGLVCRSQAELLVAYETSLKKYGGNVTPVYNRGNTKLWYEMDKVESKFCGREAPDYEEWSADKEATFGPGWRTEFSPTFTTKHVAETVATLERDNVNRVRQTAMSMARDGWAISDGDVEIENEIGHIDLNGGERRMHFAERVSMLEAMMQLGADRKDKIHQWRLQPGYRPMPGRSYDAVVCKDQGMTYACAVAEQDMCNVTDDPLPKVGGWGRFCAEHGLSSSDPSTHIDEAFEALRVSRDVFAEAKKAEKTNEPVGREVGAQLEALAGAIKGQQVEGAMEYGGV